MSNMYGKDKFHDRQKAVLQKSAQKIENDSGWSQDNFLRGYAEEILPASGAELSFGELCAIGEQVEQEAAFSAKEAMRNKIKARRDAERYKSTGTDSEQRTPNPFEDSSAIATESPKNEDTLNTMRKHADAQPTKSAGIKTSKKQSLVETTRELKKYITPLTNEEFRWALDFQMSEVRARNAAAYTMDGFVEMARFSISFEEAKAFKASRNQGIRKNEWQDLTVVVGIWSKTQK